MKKSIMSTASATATATTITKPQPRVRAQATPPRMNTTTLTIGLDLGDKVSDYCVLSAAGEVLEEGRVKTTRDAFTARFAALPAVRLALETGTHSNWAAQHLSDMGHEVLVANARELKAITGSDRKCDKADAEKLARYARVDPGILRPITPRSQTLQADLVLIRVRDRLVQMRTESINTARGLVKSLGHRLPVCDAHHFGVCCREALPAVIADPLGPLLTLIQAMSVQIREYDHKLEQLVKDKYPETAALISIPGVGTLTALTFVLTIADKSRFASSREVGPYVGLRPRRRQSGERDPQLGITKAGDIYLRKLLVQCAHIVLGRRTPDSALKRWGLRLAARGGKNAKKRALVAVARKLAVLLHKLWVSQQPFAAFYGVTAPPAPDAGVLAR